MALTKFCNKQGCKNLCPITDRYCADHVYLLAEQEAERQKRYDTTVRRGRDAQYFEFYHSPEWEKMRAYIIAKYKGLDVYAYYVKHKVVVATVVHHVHPLREAWLMRLAEQNLIPLSGSSHSEIERLYKNNKQETQTLLIKLIEKWKNEFRKGV